MYIFVTLHVFTIRPILKREKSVLKRIKSVIKYKYATDPSILSEYLSMMTVSSHSTPPAVSCLWDVFERSDGFGGKSEDYLSFHWRSTNVASFLTAWFFIEVSHHRWLVCLRTTPEAPKAEIARTPLNTLLKAPYLAKTDPQIHTHTAA